MTEIKFNDQLENKSWTDHECFWPRFIGNLARNILNL